MAASSKGEGKKAEAAWLWWCSPNSSRFCQSKSGCHFFISSRSSVFWNSFSFSHSGMAMRNELKPRGAKAR